MANESSGAFRDPKWLHETLTLKIGEHAYSFRTLSLYDVWRLWPDLYAVKEMSLRGRPLSMIEHAKKILEWIAPVLVANEADCKAFTQDHANILLDWYRRQDWGRMQTLGGETTKTDGDGDEKTREEKHQVFFAVVAAGARHAGMGVTEFVQQRFELCADAIQSAYATMRDAAEKAGEEVGDGRSHSWREATMKLAATFGVKPEAISESAKPEWMKFLDHVKVQVN